MNAMHDEPAGTGPASPEATPESTPAATPAATPGTAPGAPAAVPGPQTAPAAPDPYAARRPAAPPRPQPDPRAKSPALACVLSLMPGLGQIYVGYYLRGFIHAIVVASVITLLATGDLDELTPLLGFFLPFFWLYNIIDAGRRASFYNHVLAGGQQLELPDDFTLPGVQGSTAGGVFLIGAGLLLLLHTQFDLSLDWMIDWWPVVPILFGVFLLFKAIQERSSD